VVFGWTLLNTIGAGPGRGVREAVGVNVAVGVGVKVTVGVRVSVAVAVKVGVNVIVGVMVGVGSPTSTLNLCGCAPGAILVLTAHLNGVPAIRRRRPKVTQCHQVTPT